MIAGAAALLLALGAQGGAAAPQASAAPPETTMMIVEFRQGARFVGFPRRCPGATEDDGPDDICMAELYQGQARVVRHLSGPHPGRDALVRLTAHARNWRPGTRMIVATVPFEDQGTSGQFAFWWELPEDEGAYCLEADLLARWQGDGAISRRFAYGSRRRFWPAGYSRPAEFRCIED